MLFTSKRQCAAWNIKMHLYELFISWETKMNEGSPYLEMWGGVRVSFCRIIIVCFLSIIYRSDGLYYKMAGTPSSPTRFFLYSYSYITYTYILQLARGPCVARKHQGTFIRAVYLVGDEDERGKALSTNLERCVGTFLQNCHFFPILQI